MLTTLLLGFALGLRHATDADHIVAVSGLLDRHAAQSPRRAAHLGALWGLGHMAAVLLAGGVVVALRVAMPAWLGWALELLVALVLIALGVRIIFNCFRGRYHFHTHRHGELPHAHLHFHASQSSPHDHAGHLPRALLANDPAPNEKTRTGASVAAGDLSVNQSASSTPLLIGAAHGLAGSAGLALLVLATIPSQSLGALYLVAFGGGALVGMAAFSALLSWPLRRLATRDAWLARIRFAAGAANAGLGGFLVYRAMQPGAWPF